MLDFLKQLKDYINGNFAYEQYLKHHKDCQKLSKKEFLRQKSANKWNKVNRCC